MAAYDNNGFPGARGWRGEEHHVVAAFAYARTLGDVGVASNLLRQLAKRCMLDEPNPLHEDPIGRSPGGGPVRHAARDQMQAHITYRDVRAAQLLDKTVTIDNFILSIEG